LTVSNPLAAAVMAGSPVNVGDVPRVIVIEPWVVLPPPEPVSGATVSVPAALIGTCSPVAGLPWLPTVAS